MTDHDPIAAGVLLLAEKASPAAVAAASLELLDETVGLDWANISLDTRRRVIALAASGWRSAPARALIVSAVEDADPAGEVVVTLRPEQLGPLIARVETALDNPFGDDAEYEAAVAALNRLRDAVARLVVTRRPS